MDEETVRALIAGHFGVEPERAVDTALFDADLGADSLDVVELILLLENDLGVSIDADEGARCLCVGDALRLIREMLARPACAAAPMMAPPARPAARAALAFSPGRR
jgi:acyl carrier protein